MKKQELIKEELKIIDKEIEFTENAMANERNTTQVTFYEGYIKGLRFYKVNLEQSLNLIAKKTVEAVRLEEQQFKVSENMELIDGWNKAVKEQNNKIDKFLK